LRIKTLTSLGIARAGVNTSLITLINSNLITVVVVAVVVGTVVVDAVVVDAVIIGAVVVRRPLKCNSPAFATFIFLRESITLDTEES
jgi:hypothetical protein